MNNQNLIPQNMRTKDRLAWNKGKKAIEYSKIPNKSCSICNSVFKPNMAREKTCSVECKKILRNNISKDWRKKNPRDKKEEREYNAKYRKNNLEKLKIQNKKYWIARRKERICFCGRKFFATQKLKKYCSFSCANNNKEERQKLYSKINRAYFNKLLKERRKQPRYHLEKVISNAIQKSLKSKQPKNYRKWEKLVGYTLEQLKEHLEKQFTKKMNWKNLGKYWHIDHRIPVSWFEYQKAEEKEFLNCWSLLNLQPKEKKENLVKNNKYAEPCLQQCENGVINENP